MTVKQYLTIENLWKIEQETGKNFELIDGELVEMAAASFLPSKIALKIGSYLLIHVEKHNLGHVTTTDGGYIMSGEKRNVFMPDVGFISKERLPEIPEREAPVPPDFAVEVVSPTDSVKQVQLKASNYLSFGTQLVWIVYPQEQMVDVCRLSDDGRLVIKTVDINGILSGEDVIPDFELVVKNIFS